MINIGDNLHLLKKLNLLQNNLKIKRKLLIIIIIIIIIHKIMLKNKLNKKYKRNNKRNNKKSNNKYNNKRITNGKDGKIKLNKLLEQMKEELKNKIYVKN
jgi:hypothetical protein